MTISLGQLRVQCGCDEWLSSVHKGREISSCKPWEQIPWPLSGWRSCQRREGWMHWTVVGYLMALLQPPLLVSSVGAAPQARGSPEVWGEILSVWSPQPVLFIEGDRALPRGRGCLPSAAAAQIQALPGLFPTPALPAPSPAGGLDWPGGVEPQGQNHGQPQARGDAGQFPALAGGGAAAEEAPRQRPADHVRTGGHHLATLPALPPLGTRGHDGISIPQGRRLPRQHRGAGQEAGDVHQGLGRRQPGECCALPSLTASTPSSTAPQLAPSVALRLDLVPGIPTP